MYFLMFVCIFYEDNFKEIRSPFSEIDVIILVRFHPSLPVLVCYKCNKITVFSASKSSIPFSNWKESEIKFEGLTAKQITSLQWNVSFTQ
jgi:hypothetical protein